MASDPIGPVDIDLQGKQPTPMRVRPCPVCLGTRMVMDEPSGPTDSEMLDWLIEAVNSTRLGAFIADRKALRALMEADRDR